MQISVAIGRNVGDEPMEGIDWYHYKRDLIDLLNAHGFTISCSERGRSVYYPPNHTWETRHREEHYRLFAERTQLQSLQAPAGHEFKCALADLAEKYHQWGIMLQEVKPQIVAPNLKARA